LEIFFYWCGARVHFEEVGGLLCKKSGPNRYARFLAAGSRSEGPDRLGADSNLGRSKLIGWPGLKGGDGGGAGRRETFPAAAPRRRGPKPVFRWPFCLGFGPGMITATRVIHLGLLLGSGKAGAACATLVAVLRGGARRREVPGHRSGPSA